MNAMAEYNVRIHSKLSYLRYKYRDLDTSFMMKNTHFGHLLFNLHIVYPDYINELPLVEKKYLSIKAKRKRYRSHLRKMLFRYGELYLVSLTFRDDVFSSTDEKTRLKYVQRWCKEFTLDYFGCVDFGKKNGREHYHIIVALDTTLSKEMHRNRLFVRFEGLDLWSYGFSSCRPILSSAGSPERSLDYAFKSALYSFKSADKATHKPFHSRGVDYSQQYYYINPSNALF